MKILKNIFWCAASVALLSSCTEDDYKLYDTTQKDSVFFEVRNDRNELVDRIDYAYNYDIATVHTIEIPVTLMGVPKDYERVINVVPVADGTDMVEGKNYTVTNNVIAPNAVSGVVHVNLIRDQDPEILTKAKQVTFTIAESDDLRPVGKNSITVSYSDIRPDVRPSWWLDNKPMPVYSYENAQMFFEYFYRLAPEANPEFFDAMISAYGDYFVKATNKNGPVTLYEVFLRVYVLKPMYLEHPEIEWQSNPLY